MGKAIIKIKEAPETIHPRGLKLLSNIILMLVFFEGILPVTK